MDRVAFYGVLITSIYYADAAIKCGTCLQPPNYVSSFIKLKAQSAQSEAIILHNITEVPIKVDVQVKPISGNDTNFFFPGLGSSQQDDDKQGVYGGVVYKYNETAVKLYVPNRNDGSSDGSVIFTGYSNTWFGPKVQKEDAAEVRIRVWTACKFPTPDYESNWIPMKIKNGSDSFREIRHGLGYAPNYVTVQVWNNGTDWYADGIASGMTPSNVNKLTSWGGVVYAFNDTHVRIWVPGFDTGSIFSVADGWGQGSQETWSEGLVKVRVWGHMPGDSVYASNATIGQVSRGNTSPRLRGVTGSLNMDAGLISVTVKALGGDNNGFSFPALGAVQNTDPHDKFGGVVYSYSTNGIRIWHPIVPGAGNTAQYHKGTLLYVSPYWGGGKHSQDSKFGLIEVRFWNSYTGQCPPPTTPAYAITSPFSGTTSNTSSPATSVPVLSSTSTKIATALLTSTKYSASTQRPTPHMQTTRAISTNISHSSRTAVSMTTTSGSNVGGRTSTRKSVTVSAGVGTTAGPKGSGTTSGSVVPGVTLATNSSIPKTTMMGRIETASGGLSSVATGLIATASILSAAGCLGGLIFGFLKKKKKAKKQQRVDPEGQKTDAFGSQTVTDDNGGPPTDDGNSPTNDGDPPPDGDTRPTDDKSPPKDKEVPSIDNDAPDTANGSPPASTVRPQTARPE